MNLKPIIVREYLESLTEKNELNRIFPILLESMGLTILSKPTEYLGLQEYGKDIVAVGKDEDGQKKRFYFELKGGKDRNITESNFRGKDGIHDSIIQASYNKFVSAYSQFDNLPLKIVIVHNGIIEGNIQSTYENFIIQTEKNLDNTSFDRWDISRLTSLFTENLFSAYLLTDPETTKLFNRVLVNLDAVQGVSKDFIQLIDIILTKTEWKAYKTKLPRKWQQLFESLKLISFIVYTESKTYNNLDIARRYLTHLVLRFWNWILKNDLEADQKIIKYFTKVFLFFYDILSEYMDRTQYVVEIEDGIFSEISGRYEQVGYTYRTLEYLQTLCFMLNIERELSQDFNAEAAVVLLDKFIQKNTVSARPLIDIHSIPIIDVLNLFIELNEIEKAKNYLRSVLGYIRYGKGTYNRLPDANNNIESVIKYIVTGDKPVYYSDSTSPLLAVLMEYIALFNMEEEYNAMQKFILDYDIDLGLFIPHHSINSTSTHLIEDKENDLEEQLFSRSVRDGYQVDTKLSNHNRGVLTFEEFKEKLEKRKSEFVYEYRTDKVGLSFLRDLAHHYFKTPYFPDKWRNIEL